MFYFFYSNFFTFISLTNASSDGILFLSNFIDSLENCISLRWAAQPAYILAHGGGWVGGQKEQGAFQGSAEFFASRGFVAFNVRSLHVLDLSCTAPLQSC